MRVEELRSTLAGRADEVGTGDPVGRLGAVRSRIVVARRRRRTAVVATAVAALALAGGVAVPALQGDRSPDPVDSGPPDELAGMAVPRALTAAGFGYDYVGGVESAPGEPVLSHTLPRSDEPRLVMWTSSHADDRPSLRLRDAAAGATEASAPRGFDRYTLLHEGIDHELRLTQPGAPAGTVLAMAFFELADEPPAGVTNSGATFREQVLTRTLVGARIGDPGETDVSLTVTAPAGGLWLSETCSGVSDRTVTAEVTVNGAADLGFSCTAAGDRDPGADARRLRGSGIEAGREVEVRIRLVEKGTDRPAESPRAVLGVAVYGGQVETVGLTGTRVPVAIEHDGHVWAHDGYTYESEPGSRSVGVSGRARKVPVLVRTGATGFGDEPVAVRTLLGGKEQGRTELSSVSGWLGNGFVVQPGTPVVVEARADRAVPGLRLGVLYYEMVR